MKRLIACAAVAAGSLGLLGVVPAAATPTIPEAPNAKAAEKGAGLDCDMGLFHSELAKEGKIGKNRGHYPGQHKGASVCKFG